MAFEVEDPDVESRSTWIVLGLQCRTSAKVSGWASRLCLEVELKKRLSGRSILRKGM